MTWTVSRNVLAAAALVLAMAAHAQETARMDQVVQQLVDAKQFMGSVLVARGDQVLFNKAYGNANLEWHIANTATTKFRIGSITKQFTAASILLLEERGKLKLEDPIKKHLADAPAAWDAVTLRHLLTHTSGIANFTSFPEFQKRKQFETKLADLIVSFKDQALEFAPGEKMAYSNSGYILLGHVIEKASGTSYADFVQANIFAPLGMKDSGYDSNALIIERRAAGYTRKGEVVVNADFVHMSIPHAAGGLYSTTEDLLSWQRGLYGGKLLSAASLTKMTTPFKNDYALGIAVHGGKRKVYSHGGGIEGFNTQLAYYPETQVTVVALGNMNGGAPADIVAKLGLLAHGESITLTEERKEISVPREVLEQYVGTYRLRPGFDLVIKLEDRQLMVQATGQGSDRLYPETSDTFFSKVVDATIQFHRDAQGRVTHLTLNQGQFKGDAPRQAP